MKAGIGSKPGWVALIIFSLAACASTQKSMVIPYDVYLTVDADVNPNQQGQASPIQVGIYQLASATQFSNLDFFAIQDRSKASLGEDLVAVDQLILHPGDSRQLHYAGNARATQLGMVAGYRQLDRHQWRSVVALPAPRNTNLYKFWQGNPRRIAFQVAVHAGGLTVTRRP